MKITNKINTKDYKPLAGFITARSRGGIADLYECRKDVDYQESQYSISEAIQYGGWFYPYVYEVLNIDLIRWEVENGVFDFKRGGAYIEKYAPDLKEA